MKKFKNVLPVIFGAALILTACGTQMQDETVSSEVSDVTVTEESDETSVSDRPSLCDNYYRYVNYDFMEDTVIPEGEGRWGWFDILNRNNQEIINGFVDEIIENYDDLEEGSDERMIADLYFTLCDFDTRNSVGLGPFQEYIDRIQSAETAQELIEIDGGLNRDLYFPGILEVNSEFDSADSSRYCRQIYGNFSILSKETLLDNDFDDLRPDYEAFLAECLKRTGYDDADSAFYAAEIVDFQVGIAPYGLDLLDLSVPEMSYNVYTVEELDDLFSNVDIAGFLKTSELDKQDYQIVNQPELCAKINEVLIDDDLDFLKAYESCMIMFPLRNFMDVPFNEAWLAFRSELYGLNGVTEPESYVREVLQTVFETELGKMYVETYFSEDDKQAVTEMAENIIDRYRERIMALDWMEDSTKEAAIEKLDNLVLQIGYPDEWDCYYDSTKIKGPDEGGTLADNIYVMIRADADHESELTSAPVDRKRWLYGAQDVNAYCNYVQNTICFPAGILQAPFYRSDASPEENYGGIGFQIGHEISHIFDSNGSLYDSNGNANIWWTDEDYANFAALTQKMIDYYDGMELNGRKIDGARTVNENIADLGAISVTASFFEDDTEALDRMFRYHTWTYASVATKEYLDYIISSDEHAPDEIRTNGILRNLDSFYDVYPEITEGDGMYLAPEDRIKIW